MFSHFSDNRGADPRASQETQGAYTMRLREAESGPVPCSGARRQNKVLDEVSAAILGGVAAENVKLRGWATTTKNYDNGKNYRSNTAFRKRHGFAQSISSAWFGDKCRMALLK